MTDSDKTKKVGLNDEQLKAVTSKGRVIVSASAGSGKTHTLIERIAYKLSNGASLRDMLILVYNVAAADELKERLTGKLFELIGTARDKAEKERLMQELDDVCFAKICTIHSYCTSLVRENFQLLGISPTFGILDENTESAYKEEAFSSVVNNYATSGDNDFFDIIDLFSEARKEDNLKENVYKLFESLDVQPSKEDFINTVKETYGSFENSKFIDILFHYYHAFLVNAAKRFKENYERTLMTKYPKFQSAAKYYADICSEAATMTDFFSMSKYLIDRFEKQTVERRKHDGSIDYTITEETKDFEKELIDVIDAVRALRDTMNEYKERHGNNGKQVEKLLEIVLKFDEEFKRIKRENNVLSFNDILHLSAEVIDAGVDEHYECVFVDEYQDVDPIQEFVINKLIGDSCFIVGDVKQSIYAFRLADPKIFIRREERFKAGEGTAIKFNRNFRSAYEILKFVNGVFSGIMTKETADIDYALDGAFDLDGADKHGDVQICLFSDDKSEKPLPNSGLYDITTHAAKEVVKKGEDYEGEFIAEKIRRLMDGKYLVSDKDEARPIRYGDIAILFRSRSTAATTIIEHLKAHGIPVDESAFSSAASSPEREIINFLRVIDNPVQDVPLAGFLLSYFGKYDESELSFIASSDGNDFYSKCVLRSQSEDALGNKLKDTFLTLEKYRIKASFKSVRELINGIINDYSYDAYLMRYGEGEAYKLHAFVSSIDTAEDMPLGKFLSSYSAGNKQGVNAGGGERVHISTFHGYKGLESPVVFVSDIGQKYKNSSSKDLQTYGCGYIGMKYFDVENKIKYDTLSKLALQKLVEEEELKSEMRLLYVALTRAKQLMYITANVTDKDLREFGEKNFIGNPTSNLGIISLAKVRGNLDGYHATKHPNEREHEEKPVINPHATRVCDEKLKELILSKRSFEYPFKSATGLAMKYSVSAIGHLDDGVVKVYKDEANVGTLYHKVMQNIDYFATDVRQELVRMTEENIITKEEAESIDVSVIERCLKSDIMNSAREASLEGKCYREQPFIMYKPANEIDPSFSSDDKILVQGVIDLYIDGKEKILADFKYSRLSDSKLAKKYEKQLYLYKTAIENSFSVKIDKVVLYSFVSGSTIELNV